MNIIPKDNIFEVKNEFGKLIGTLKIYKGAFGLYLWFNQAENSNNLSSHYLEKILNFMKNFEKKNEH